MRKTFNYKANVNKKTSVVFLGWVELCRKLYNTALEQRITLWTHRRKSLSYIDQTYEIKNLRKEFPEYAAINSQVLQDPLKRIDLAFQAFYKRCKLKGIKSGFPKFKPRGFYRSITFKNTGWDLNDKYLDVHNVGRFKLFLSRPIEGDIKTITIRLSMTNKWFVSFSCDNVPEKQHIQTNSETTISDDGVLTAPPNMIKSINRLDKIQKEIENKQKNSNRRIKTRLLIEKIYEKIVNQRKDFLHKNTNKIIKENDTINIIDSPKSDDTKPLLTMGWYMLIEMLKYKASEAHRLLQLLKKDTKNGNKNNTTKRKRSTISK